MKGENDLILLGIESEIKRIEKSLLNLSIDLKISFEKSNFENALKEVETISKMMKEISDLRDLKRSKNSLVDLDSNYDVFKNSNFSTDDIPF